MAEYFYWVSDGGTNHGWQTGIDPGEMLEIVRRSPEMADWLVFQNDQFAKIHGDAPLTIGAWETGRRFQDRVDESFPVPIGSRRTTARSSSTRK